VGLELGPFSLVRVSEELLESNSSIFVVETRDYWSWEPAMLTTQHFSLRKNNTKIRQPAAADQSVQLASLTDLKPRSLFIDDLEVSVVCGHEPQGD
jgi:hypothetical protein